MKRLIAALALIAGTALAVDKKVLINPVQDGNLTVKVNDGGVTTSVMTFQGASGNVGIGTTAPTVALDVVGTVKSTGLTVGTGNQTITATKASTLGKYTTGSGTYTTPTGVRWIRVRMVGGGGGGGASVESGSRNGASGSDTTFGSSVAKGGYWGATYTLPWGGAGGVAGTIGGDTISGFTIAGGGGAAGIIAAGTHVYQPGNVGGNSYFGGGATAAVGGACPVGAANTGGGGCGGGCGNAQLFTGGGGGAGGYTEVIIVPTLNQAFSYAVGPGGNGGTTDHVQGWNGSSGGSGVILYEENY